MSPLSTSAPGVRSSDFRFRCIACGDLTNAAAQNFRCAQCGDLLEITYPAWKNTAPDAARAEEALARATPLAWKRLT